MRRVLRTVKAKYVFDGCQMLIIVHYLTSSKPVNIEIVRRTNLTDVRRCLFETHENY